MSRRIHPCLGCHEKYRDQAGVKFPARRGYTRHDDRMCSVCRHYGPPMPDGWPWGRAA